MSIVRYTNKKTGQVALYESTSHYDPVTKQSRPIRKYLGIEDPVTGELIPSTGKPGRKKAVEKGTAGQENNAAEKVKKTTGVDYQLLYEQQKKACAEKDRQIKELRNRNKILYADLERLKETISKMLAANQISEE